MGDFDNELFDVLKERPDKEPDKVFSNQMRQQLQKGQIVKRKRVSVATILTIPVTMAVLAFLIMICTGQTLDIKSAAQLSITQEKSLVFTGSLCILIALLTFIIFVFSKGYTKGWFIFLMFSLSFLAWVMNTVHAENQHLEEPTVPTNSKSFDHDQDQSLSLSDKEGR
ncbi:hypothetical protein [Lysinibacillus parviboronicapiens]|uniref:hypothetical protein n=1 Tax=Lysinibacillus parviboronicapiens TaxID=436516 RepID=UPI0006D0D3DB|nr:hypothetical protein [Lysinibacillus parviboronicapiens]